MGTEKKEKSNCFRCIYYINTWIPNAPRGCKFFGFKSAKIPSAVVLETTGEKCTSFVIKK